MAGSAGSIKTLCQGKDDHTHPADAGLRDRARNWNFGVVSLSAWSLARDRRAATSQPGSSTAVGRARMRTDRRMEKEYGVHARHGHGELAVDVTGTGVRLFYYRRSLWERSVTTSSFSYLEASM